MSHGRRESQVQHDNHYSCLVYDIGEKCGICKRKIGDAYPKEVTSNWNIGSRITRLYLDHKNGNPKDNRYENKQLSCEACNLIKSLKNDVLRRALSDAMRASNDGAGKASDGGVERVCEREYASN